MEAVSKGFLRAAPRVVSALAVCLRPWGSADCGRTTISVGAGLGERVREAAHSSRRLSPGGLAALLVTLGLLLAHAAATTPAARAHEDHPGATVPVTEAPGLRLERIGAFYRPVYVTSAPGDSSRLFIVERRGTIRVTKDGVVDRRPFLDIRDLVDTGRAEAGALSIAFAPDYGRSGRFYIAYVQRDLDIRLEELRRDPNDPGRALRSSRRLVREIEHSDAPVHFGGQLEFGPDGLLYWSVGDGQWGTEPRRNAQSLGTLLGKILRIDPRRQPSGAPYRIPSSNPFVGRPGRDEIWSYGLRNPWRFSFDRATGALWIGDVGEDRWEEINFSPPSVRGRGANFGWSCFEGLAVYGPYRSCQTGNYVFPTHVYRHRDGGACSVTGGYVLRDTEIVSLSGSYLYGDYCTGALHALRRKNGRVVENRSLGLVVPRLTSFGRDGSGGVYVASWQGSVYRLRSTTRP